MPAGRGQGEHQQPEENGISALPSTRAIAEEYGVAYLTVRRAARVLRERGLILTVHGKGTFVADPLPTDDGHQQV
ncbi:GntR family transcriptional regulator [Streptomyces sp. NPDC006551]|uniref:GntR family transcriptional regulator n=1 Tax=Streptomyces sp. NPDC006551 TaxID=3157178 RepID=UPI0033AB93D2